MLLSAFLHRPRLDAPSQLLLRSWRPSLVSWLGHFKEKWASARVAFKSVLRLDHIPEWRCILCFDGSKGSVRASSASDGTSTPGFLTNSKQQLFGGASCYSQSFCRTLLFAEIARYSRARAPSLDRSWSFTAQMSHRPFILASRAISRRFAEVNRIVSYQQLPRIQRAHLHGFPGRLHSDLSDIHIQRDPPR